MDKLAISVGDVRDYLVVQYADGILRVAADQLGSLGRYRATSETPPQLSKMGGAAWTKAKERARKAVRKVALDLVKLYAERQQADGFAFPVDGPWQSEMEESFPYEATPDQLKATVDVKRDMEKAEPMDRLVCGDVGFGKTEVAIRAIFKAITAGKQVAMLAPTTVLAQQHWRTLSERFAPYPIKVALLNRFRTASERKAILDGLKEGTIDAVVGTHQLLSKGASFQQLGLLVVDEEQRFGVNQKGKDQGAAQGRRRADPLSDADSQNPLHELVRRSGDEPDHHPPPLRRPIKTHLAALDPEAVRSAIRQELDRGGQVFYVVPRVEGIEDVATGLRAMLPDLKLLVAHGQMAEGELESAMVAFNAGEADVMLCTTIVESGLDIPRVNTILIEDAHRFGLAQLYQLRGRVGRSGIQAHAWLFYPGNASLSDAARQRLRAIQELPSSAAATNWPCAIWKFEAWATCSAWSRAGRWKPSASTSTWKCCRNPWRRFRVKTSHPWMTPRWIYLSPPSFLAIGSQMPTRRLLPIGGGGLHLLGSPPGACGGVGRSVRRTARCRPVVAAADGTEAAGQTLWILTNQTGEAEHRPGDTHGRTSLPPPASGSAPASAWAPCLPGWFRHPTQGAGQRPGRASDGKATGATDGVAEADGCSDPRCRRAHFSTTG